MVWSTSPQQISWSHMFYAIECLWPTRYGWCIVVLVNMRAQVIDWRLKNFGCKSILVSFFMERVPTVCTHTIISPIGHEEPHTCIWYVMMQKREEGCILNACNNELFIIIDGHIRRSWLMITLNPIWVIMVIQIFLFLLARIRVT